MVGRGGMARTVSAASLPPGPVAATQAPHGGKPTRYQPTSAPEPPGGERLLPRTLVGSPKAKVLAKRKPRLPKLPIPQPVSQMALFRKEARNFYRSLLCRTESRFRGRCGAAEKRLPRACGAQAGGRCYLSRHRGPDSGCRGTLEHAGFAAQDRLPRGDRAALPVTQQSPMPSRFPSCERPNLNPIFLEPAARSSGRPVRAGKSHNASESPSSPPTTAPRTPPRGDPS